jgi:hypothetical protein
MTIYQLINELEGVPEADRHKQFLTATVVVGPDSAIIMVNPDNVNDTPQ